MSENLAKQMVGLELQPTISFFDLEKNMTCTYPVPCLTEKCPECGHFEWKQIDADWEDGQSEKKWMSFRCQGRKFITTHFKRHGVHDGYWIKCELVVRLPIDEATRVSTEVEGEL